MGFFPSYGCVNTTVCMHHMVINKIHVRWKLHKNPTCYFKQLLEATHHKTAAGWPLTSHLKTHSSKMNKTCRTWLEKQGQTHKWRLSKDPYTLMHQGWVTSKNLHHLYEDTGCSLENLLEAKNDWDRWREREREREFGKSEQSVWLD